MESLTPVVNYILEGEFPKEFTTGQRRKLIKQASTFLWLEGSLYQKGKDLVCRRVPSTNEIPKILKGLHEEACGGHFSHELTLKKVLLAGYVWPSMHADVQHWCRSCHNCQVNGNKKLLYGPRQAVIANGPFEKWGIDAMGPLPRTANGKRYILVAIDYMTRWVEAQSVVKVNEKTVSKFVYTHICCRFGTPLEIVSDNGPGFRRGLLTEVCEELKISHRHSTPYYPQSNGLVEKANGIIAGIIRKMVESKPKRWDNFLDGAIWAYRTTYRDATQFTPFHLVYGQEALQPIELNIPTIKLTGRQEQSNDEAWIDRLLNLVELEWKREAAYHCYKKKTLQLKDKLNEGIKDKEIKEKSLVLRYNNALDNRFDAKFERRWEGPFIVKKAFTGGYYQLMDLNGKEHPRKVNGYRLKPYLSRILPAVFETKQVSKKTKKEKEVIDLSGTVEYLKKLEREKHTAEQRAAQLAREKIKETLSRKAEEPVLEPTQGSPKRPRQEEEEDIEHIQADTIPPSPINIPPAPPSSPITPFPPTSTPRTPPSPSPLDLPKSPPAPTSPQQQQFFAEPIEVQSLQEETEQPMDKTEEEEKQIDSEQDKPTDVDLLVPMIQLDEPTNEEAIQEVKSFDYKKIIQTLSRQFQCQQVVTKETDFQKDRANKAHEEITNLRTALQLVTQERDTNARENENLLRDLIDLQS
ncbi:hypothetical protein L7F22_047527 [Adiantum nelumboides]|nr:hypothetical protein [Adiantum nelumboides]